MPPTQYRPSRRNWIKLWTHEWLTGTIRWATPEQRAIWADLLALAGDSRFPGVVCSGHENGKYQAYPEDWLCGVLRCSPETFRLTLKLFLKQDRITVKNGVVFITNWEKYQSEYQEKRQRREYKNNKQRDLLENVRTKSDQNSTNLELEGEGEVEVEGEEEGEKDKTIVRQTPPDAPSFEQFISVYPRPEKKLDARKAWDKIPVTERGAILAGLADWIRCDQWQDKQFVPLPATFLRAKQWNDSPIKFGGRNGNGNYSSRSRKTGAHFNDQEREERVPVKVEVFRTDQR